MAEQQLAENGYVRHDFGTLSSNPQAVGRWNDLEDTLNCLPRTMPIRCNDLPAGAASNPRIAALDVANDAVLISRGSNGFRFLKTDDSGVRARGSGAGSSATASVFPPQFTHRPANTKFT